jgi:rubrerythrin
MKSFKEMITECSLEDYNDIQLLRKGMQEELKAITLYENMADKASDDRLRLLFLDIADEEQVHCAEFEELLELIDETWEESEDKAQNELTDIGI